MRSDLRHPEAFYQLLRPADRPITDLRLEFLIAEQPAGSPLAGVWALQVAPAALRHPALPQPDAATMYTLLTRHKRRDPGIVVHLVHMTDELDLAGLTWHRIGVHWQSIVDTLTDLAATRAIPAIPLR